LNAIGRRSVMRFDPVHYRNDDVVPSEGLPYTNHETVTAIVTKVKARDQRPLKRPGHRHALRLC
jgi:hypothetical protein